MAKFKKGDRVRYLGNGGCLIPEGTICIIDENGSTCPSYHTEEKDTDGEWVHDCCEDQAHFELIESNKGENNMSETINVAAAIRNSGLTENQRILREQGLVDDCGNVTSAGQAAIWALLITDKEDQLVAAIKAELKAKDTTKAKK